MSAEVEALRVEWESRAHDHAMAFMAKGGPVRFDKMVDKPIVFLSRSFVLSVGQPAVVRTIWDHVTVRRAGYRVASELTQRKVQFETVDWYPGAAFDTQEVLNVVGEVKTVGGHVEADP